MAKKGGATFSIESLGQVLAQAIQKASEDSGGEFAVAVRKGMLFVGSTYENLVREGGPLHLQIEDEVSLERQGLADGVSHPKL